MVSEGAQGGSFLPLPDSSGSRRPLACGHLTPMSLSLHMASPLPTCVLSGCHLQGHLSEDGGSAQLAQDDLTLRSLVTFTKTLFSSNVTFTGPRA